MNDPLKQCRACKKEKPLSAFYQSNHKSYTDGRENTCKECRIAQRKAPPPLPLPDGMKVCTKCKSIKVASSQFFFRDNRTKDGFSCWCKWCDTIRKGRTYQGPAKIARPGHKICPQCEKELPTTTEHFYRDKTTISGLKPICKSCMAKRLGQTRKTQEPPVLDGLKRCTKCKNVYDATTEFFHRSHAHDLGLSPICKKCIMADGATYRTNNRDVIRRRERMRLTFSRAARHRREARKKSLPDTLTSAQWQRCLDYWCGCCVYCGRTADLFRSIALDHFVALSDPGCPGTTVLNVLPACHGAEGCNNSKCARPAAEWLESKFGVRKAKRILGRIADYFEWVQQQTD